MQPQPPSARRHYLWSAALAQRAVREARKARTGGATAVATAIAAHQAAAAYQAQPVVAQMLNEQAIDEASQALINTMAFVTLPQQLGPMLEQVATDYHFDLLVASLVQDAGRAAEQVATAVTPRVGYVRLLSPPSCSRCAILAGRVYRYSEGFQRHPGCDCTMTPTSLTNPAEYPDPVELTRQGLVTGLSKADRRAINDGADFGQVVNARRSGAGLRTPGRALIRNGRPTPEGIYRAASSRDDAIQRLITAGYVRS